MTVKPTVRDLIRRGVPRVTGHAELFKRDEHSGRMMLVSTTRPCEICGQPLEGLVIPKWEAREEGQSLVHEKCRSQLGIGGFRGI